MKREFTCSIRWFAQDFSGTQEIRAVENRWVKNNEKEEQAAPCIDNFSLFPNFRSIYKSLESNGNPVYNTLGLLGGEFGELL